jgi:hypothetical protein
MAVDFAHAEHYVAGVGDCRLGGLLLGDCAFLRSIAMLGKVVTLGQEVSGNGTGVHATMRFSDVSRLLRITSNTLY